MLQPHPLARHIGRRARNNQRRLGTLATSVKTTIVFTIAVVASTAVAESPIEARPPPGSRGRAMVAVPNHRAFLEVGLPHLTIGRQKLVLQHYDP